MIDLTGRKFGRWYVSGLSEFRKGPHAHWDCICDCGERRAVAGPSLRSGLSLSCGCYKRERTIKSRTKHGMAKRHPAYSSWSAMKKRCQNPNSANYAYYGGRGISLCERWNDFALFWEDMREGWAPGLTIERTDNTKGYEPGNCRWITQAEQAKNRRSTVWMDTPWGRVCQSEAARKAGIELHTLRARIKRGWPPDRWFEAVT